MTASVVSRRRFLFGRAAAGGGKVARIGGGCLEFQGIVCRACRDACDARAVGYLRLAGGLSKPVIDPAACNGCGACLGVCPAAAMSLEGAP